MRTKTIHPLPRTVLPIRCRIIGHVAPCGRCQRDRIIRKSPSTTLKHTLNSMTWLQENCAENYTWNGQAFFLSAPLFFRKLYMAWCSEIELDRSSHLAPRAVNLLATVLGLYLLRSSKNSFHLLGEAKVDCLLQIARALNPRSPLHLCVHMYPLHGD